MFAQSRRAAALLTAMAALALANGSQASARTTHSAASHSAQTSASGSVASTPAKAPEPAPPAATPIQSYGAGFPSFLLPGDVLCLDELDFNAFAKSGKFHTRGSTESCQQLPQLTRVVVLQQSGVKSKVRIVAGPLEAHVGWTSGKLPFPGPKPQQ